MSKPYIEEYIIELQKIKRKIMASVLNDDRLLDTSDKYPSSNLTMKDVLSIFSTKL